MDDIVTPVEMEQKLIDNRDRAHALVDEHRDALINHAEKKTAYRMRYAKAYTKYRNDGKSIKDAEQMAYIACEREYTDFNLAEARLKGVQQAAQVIESDRWAIMGLNANVRNQVMD